MLLGCWNKELLSVKGVINYRSCWQVICPCVSSAEKLQVWENCGRGKSDCGWWECGRDTREVGGKTSLEMCKDYQQLRGLQIQSFCSPWLCSEVRLLSSKVFVFIWVMTGWKEHVTPGLLLQIPFGSLTEAQIRATLVVQLWHRCWLIQGFHFWTLLLCCSGLMRQHTKQNVK